TNFKDTNSPLVGFIAREIEIPLRHPPILCRAVDADRVVQRTFASFGPPPTTSVAARQQAVLVSENFESRSLAIAELQDKVCRLEQQLDSQTTQSANKAHQFDEQFARVNLALDEATRLNQSMSSSLSWRLTWPLRVLRNAVIAILRR